MKQMDGDDKNNLGLVGVLLDGFSTSKKQN